MSSALQLRHERERHVEIVAPSGMPLWRYVYAPATPVNEAPRPYVHPLYSMAGDVLSDFRPDDHPWHHGLSLTLTSVDGVNFWGGPSYRAADGYQWRSDHGVQVHLRWESLRPERLEEALEWRSGGSAETLLREHRTLSTSVHEQSWTLRWTSELRNVAGRELTLGNYHALGGLAGSHYTGLQFRGARSLLPQHADATIEVHGEGGREGEVAVHGVEGRWIEWSCEHSGSAPGLRIRFENMTGPLPWFVRAAQPLVAFAFHRERPYSLPEGAALRLDHALTFSNA